MTDFASDQLNSILDSQLAPSDIASTPAPIAPMEMDHGDMDQTGDDAPPRPQRVTFAADAIPKVIDRTAMSVMESFEKFLESYEDENTTLTNISSEWPSHPYMLQLEQLKDSELHTIFIDFAHVQGADESLATALLEQYHRFTPYVRRAVQNVVKRYFPELLHVNTTSAEPTPGAIRREFAVAFYNVPELDRVRQLKTEKIGQLISVSGTVTRTTEVRPELLFASFTCNECGCIMNDVEQQFRYTEPTMCQTTSCFNRQHWSLNIEQSKFVDWQRIRIQENSDEIPTGSMPRSLDVIVRNEMVERAKAGDKCIFTGTLIVVPDVAAFRTPGTSVEAQRDTNTRAREGIANEGVTGLKSLGVRDLTYKLSFLACTVQSATVRKSSASIFHGDNVGNEDQQAVLNDLTAKEVEDIKTILSLDKDIYSKLINNIAPNIFGHDTVKKGILLQLMGGVHKVTPEGMNLRGDINVCIVGDPSTSKSQFLKYVCEFAPRAVYTSGKASSAAGLTASVIKDEETGEFSIEAGALMLADNGICCIDEFDKMDIKDQVAIHEAMEQQTISIAKAGIQATLNARTSILAAANPVGGRYNNKMTLKQNINMSAPIMSRFDLFFVVLDECNEVVDYNIARHIVNVHRLKDDFADVEFSTEQLQNYIRFARTLKPRMTAEAAKKMADCYNDLRQGDAQGMGRNSYRITVRQLESMIRLSEAIARVYGREEITEAYVIEAFNLLQKSIIRVKQDDIEFDEDAVSDDVMTSTEALRGMNLDNDVEEESQMQTDQPESSSMKIEYEKYCQLARMLAHKLREVEQNSEEESGLRRSELVQWYLEECEAEMTTEEDLENEHRMIEKVIKKLVQDGTLVEVTQRGYRETSTTAQEEGEGSDPIIMAHPNYVLEDE